MRIGLLFRLGSAWVGVHYSPRNRRFCVNLVPVEPTETMLDAALVRIKEVTVIVKAGPAKGATLVRDPHYNAYQAMLKAAPAYDDGGNGNG